MLKLFSKKYFFNDEDAEDFEQYAIIKIWQGRKATYGQLRIDYLRETYGDSRTPGHTARKRATTNLKEFYEGIIGIDRRDRRDFGFDGTEDQVRKALETIEFDHLFFINHYDGVFSESRLSQVKKYIRNEIQIILDAQEGRSIMETEQLMIEWILI